MPLTHPPRVVTREHWLEARKRLLEREKDYTRLRDALSEARRALPWVKVEKEYIFTGEFGGATLADLFGEQSQLIVYHFMFGGSWTDPCKSCSFWADNFNGIPIHLKHRDVNLVAIAHAPYPKIALAKKRMGWSFEFYSSYETDFNYDFNVSFDEASVHDGKVNYNYKDVPYGMDELPGVSVFYKDADGQIYHTYSAFSRGIDILNGAYQYLDITPIGRDEKGLGYPMEWLRLHDSYE